MLVSLGVRIYPNGSVAANGEYLYDIVVRSPDGEAVIENISASRLASGEQFTAMVPRPEGRDLPSKKTMKKLSMKQEHKAATSIGGRRQTGSGARDGAKGDGRVDGRYRLENKFTFANSLKIPLSDLEKIRSECQGLEQPIYQIEYRQRGTLRVLAAWALIPWEHAQELINDLSEADVDR